MPPRKSIDSLKAGPAANGAEEAPTTTPSKEADGLSVEDLSLPRSMIQRLAKGVLPLNTQIQKDALLAMSKSATVFVNYLSTHADEKARAAGKRTVQAENVLEALKELEFEKFLPRCEVELQKYTAIQTEKRNNYRRKVRDEKQAKEGDTTVNTEPVSSPGEARDRDIGGQETEEGRAAKKARRSSAGDTTLGDGDAAEDGDETVDDGDDDEAQAQDATEDEVEEDDEEDEEDADDDQRSDADEGLREDRLEAEEIKEDLADDDHDSDSD